MADMVTINHVEYIYSGTFKKKVYDDFCGHEIEIKYLFRCMYYPRIEKFLVVRLDGYSESDITDEPDGKDIIEQIKFIYFFEPEY